MNDYIDIQRATKEPTPITDEQIANWANIVLINESTIAELTVRLVDSDEITLLNNIYRKKDKPTNVLAFPANIPQHIELETKLLGDIIICPDVVYAECKNLNKSLESHFALMVIHGTLHLLGYDHENDADSEIMQAIEIKLLNKIGFANPYLEEQNEI